MKNLSVLLIAVIGLMVVSCSTTPKPPTIMPAPARSGFDCPLPPAFAHITNKSILPGFIPVAVYRIRDNQAAYACVGTIFPTGPNQFSVIVPEHLFTQESGPVETYGLRLARPDSQQIDGFIGQVELTSRNFSGLDVVVASVTSNNCVVTNFVTTPKRANTDIVPKNYVVTQGKLVTGLRSIITGKSASIIGYGFDTCTAINKSADELAKIPPLIIIDEPSAPGQSGTLYIDAHNRIFLLNRSLSVDRVEDAFDGLRTYYFLRDGRQLRGASLLDGPITFEYREKE